MAFRSREKRNHFYCVIIPNPKFRSDIDEHSDEDIQKFDGSWRTGHTRRERERGMISKAHSSSTARISEKIGCERACLLQTTLPASWLIHTSPEDFAFDAYDLIAEK
jgi:hypothetical protein